MNTWEEGGTGAMSTGEPSVLGFGVVEVITTKQLLSQRLGRKSLLVAQANF